MRINSLIAALGMVVLVACSKEGTKSSDSVRPADGAVATATPTAPALSDANIAALLDEVNMADSSAGKLASTKGTSVDVKAFGVMMMNDHHALRKAGQDLVAKLSVNPVAPAGDPLPAEAKMAMDSLTATAKGPAWDQWYIAHEIATHQKVLGLIDTGLGATQNAEMKDLLSKARPNVEAHLKRAQDIQGRLPAATN
ncbi:MAG: DUF4142 domain-containing protein [Gemmatimonadaceae bacterium]